MLREDIKSSINRILDKKNENYLSKDEIKKIKESVSSTSKWASLKHSGVNAIPSGDATNAFNKIVDSLKKHDIYLVEEGELESFIKDVGGHGPEWTNSVLEKYPDLDNQVYLKIKNFIKNMEL